METTDLAPASDSFTTAYFEGQDTLVTVSMRGTIRETINLLNLQIHGLHCYRSAEVPLYLALQLFDTQQATICMPEWLKLDRTRTYINNEMENPGLQELQPHFFEVSRRLLIVFREHPDEHASADLSGSATLLAIEFNLNNLFDIRRQKLKDIIDTAIGNRLAPNLTNATKFELIGLNTYKQFSDSFSEIHHLSLYDSANSA
ncbi:putative GINS complex protein [Giardia duodenalis]|uniref:GINS complex protein n=1 Tax=Giardia intestinalis (strain ATCC 50803 / WB clone C6) TaxID=184922 RepID=A8BJN0_GIAIC|nr:putative GINS complex protein [Giardia intestinalis]KAE8303924.1 putative GINS complex protein [Giardia intestinalis]|eukprot:XP_001706618.1 Hypothetical protein GL50803_101943 [Giardia lamblia ATCC 50803]